MPLSIRIKQQLQDSPLWQRWQRLSVREQGVLRLSGVVMLGLLGYCLLWQPVMLRLEDARQAYLHDREVFQYMQRNAGLIRRSSEASEGTLLAQQLQGVVTRSAQQQGLSVERFENESGGGLSVVLSQASFVSLLQWMEKLQGDGVVLAEVMLARAGDGRVDARLSLKTRG